MSSTWIDDFNQQREGMPRGNFALLRAVIESGNTRQIGGASVSQAVAGRLFRVYQSLSPHDQEIFAANCNVDFEGWARECIVMSAAIEAAEIPATEAAV